MPPPQPHQPPQVRPIPDASKAPSPWSSTVLRWTVCVALATVSLVGMGVSLADRGIAFNTRHHAPGQLNSHAVVGTQPRTADSALVRTQASSTSGSLARLIDLNTAPASELDLLPGVGPVLAARIIEDRQTNGLFKDLDDLDRVHGIGPRTIERLRDMVTVTAAAGD